MKLDDLKPTEKKVKRNRVGRGMASGNTESAGNRKKPNRFL